MPVITVTTRDLAFGAALLFFALGAGSATVIASDLLRCWNSARRAPLDEPRIHSASGEPIDELRAYAAQRRNEALRDHRIVTDAVNNMAKEIFK